MRLLEVRFSSAFYRSQNLAIVALEVLILATKRSIWLKRIAVKYFELLLASVLSFKFRFCFISGARLVLICPHKCFPILIFCFYLYLNFCLARGFT